MSRTKPEESAESLTSLAVRPSVWLAHAVHSTRNREKTMQRRTKRFMRNLQQRWN